MISRGDIQIDDKSSAVEIRLIEKIAEFDELKRQRHFPLTLLLADLVRF